MRRRTVLAQLSVFGVIALAILTYTVFALLGVKVTDRPFPVTVHLTNGGGIFTGAEVAFRGVQVGRVSSVHLAAEGVTITLSLDHGTKIPTNAIAHVYDLSAVGEQYVDLVPTGPASAYLRRDSVIPATQTTTPLQTATVLYDLERFIDSINAGDLQVLGQEGAAAFADAGPQLRAILADSATIVDQLSRSQQATSALLHNGSVLLKGAADHATDFDVFAGALQQLSATLASSTPTLTQLIQQAAPTTTLIDGIVRSNGSAIGVLLGNLATLTGIQAARVPGLQALLVAVPRFGQLAPTIVHDGVVQGVINFNANEPLCQTGVPMTSPLSGIQTPLRGVGCASPYLARGAANAPRPGAAPDSDGAQSLGASRDVEVAGYDPSTGLVTTGDGSPLQLGTAGGQQEYLGSNSWQALLLAVAGH